MAERLSDEQIARMRAEHAPVDRPGSTGMAYCQCCSTVAPGIAGFLVLRLWPCDAALLLAELEHFAPGPVPHLAGLDVGHCHYGASGMDASQPKHGATGSFGKKPERDWRDTVMPPTCHCGAVGMEISHPRHAPTSEQQVTIANGLFGPSELPR